MRKEDMISAICMRLKIIHLHDITDLLDGELHVNLFLEKLAETALETVELEGMLPPEILVEQGTGYVGEDGGELVEVVYLNKWESDDEDV